MKDPSLRRRRRRRRSSIERALEKRADDSLPVLLLLLLVGSVLAIGSVHVESFLVVAGLALATMVLALVTRRWIPAPVTGLAFALALYSALQAVPLPLWFVERLAPENADIWARAFVPFGEPAPAWAPLSIDPGASLTEGLKWLVYGIVFSLAALVGYQRGRTFIAAALFGSAVLLAGVTLIHGLAGAERIFGIYEPSFETGRWAISPLLNPNNLAGYLNLGVFTGIGLLASTHDASRRWLYAFGIALMAGQSILCGSRGGVLSLILGTVAVFFVLRRPLWNGRRVPKAGKKFVLPALSLGLLLGVIGAQQTTWDELRQEGLEKLYIVEWTRPLLQAHPWWGVGAGAFETAFPAYRASGEHIYWSHPENFVVGWLTEWGIPVGLAALAGFVYFLRPQVLGLRESRLAACSLIGLLAFSVQNLADLAFSIPGVMIGAFTLAGGLWGAENLPLPERASTRASRFKRKAAFAAPALGALGFCFVFLVGRHTAARDRRELSELVQRDPLPPPRIEPFLGRLRRAVARHPGDPHLPLLGAYVVLGDPERNPLPWLARALSRDLMNARTHLLLADVLHRNGAHAQALLELRLTVERDPALSREVAKRAMSWIGSLDELDRVLPERRDALLRWQIPTSPPRAALLTAVAQLLRTPETRERRELYLQEAIQLAPRSTQARALLAQDRIAAIQERLPPCQEDRDACQKEVERQIQTIEALDPDGSQALLLQSRLLSALGRPREAFDHLDARCRRTDLICLKSLVELSIAHDLDIDSPIQAYVTVACARASACAAAHSWAGGIYSQRNSWGKALTHYTNAAHLAGTSEAWLLVARTAQRLGSRRQTLDALENAKRFSPNDPSIAQRIDAIQRKAIVEDARH